MESPTFRLALRALVAAVAGSLALSGCNAILGMERAHLDVGADGGGAKVTGSGGRSVSTGNGGSAGATQNECTVTSDACATCVVTKCSREKTDCLGDTLCRGALATYDKCAASNCPSNGSCAEAFAGSSSDLAGALGRCLASCAKDCDVGPAVPICEIYCECMANQPNCSNEFSNNLGGDVQKCIDTCSNDSEILANAACRSLHCEFASGDKDHCKHAIGLLGFCPFPDPKRVQRCTAGIETGFPCRVVNDKNDCCSGTCDHEVCVPSG